MEAEEAVLVAEDHQEAEEDNRYYKNTHPYFDNLSLYGCF
jgi:hypothetical protein